MKLNFLGTGSAFNPYLGNTSAFYEEGDKILLIDCGSDVYRKIRFNNLLEDKKEVYICITHTHQDHVGSLATLISWCSLVKGIKVYLLLPNDTTFMVPLLTLLSTGDVYLNENYYILHDFTNLFTHIKDIEFFDVNHCVRIKSKGILFLLENKKYVIYSGDCSYIKTVLNYSYKYKDFDMERAYIDCNISCLSKINSIQPHELLSDITKSIQVDKRDLFYVMHYDSVECRETAKQLGFNVVYSYYN
ncbi:MAG: MBL fold metallo-hydrolase [Clostridia bacterium]